MRRVFLWENKMSQFQNSQSIAKEKTKAPLFKELKDVYGIDLPERTTLDELKVKLAEQLGIPVADVSKSIVESGGNALSQANSQSDTFENKQEQPIGYICIIPKGTDLEGQSDVNARNGKHGSWSVKRDTRVGLPMAAIYAIEAPKNIERKKDEQGNLTNEITRTPRFQISRLVPIYERQKNRIGTEFSERELAALSQ